jgi:uncharacterized membrane protein YdcZ (DUF606 family)
MPILAGATGATVVGTELAALPAMGFGRHGVAVSASKGIASLISGSFGWLAQVPDSRSLIGTPSKHTR